MSYDTVVKQLAGTNWSRFNCWI